jgi:hypothetical protein
MDAQTVEKINQLARSLKAMHLAASAEEAYARAKDIILGSSTEGSDKSIMEIMQDADVTGRELTRAKELLKKEQEELERLKKELADLKQKHQKDAESHEGEIKDSQGLDKDLAGQEHDLGVAEENIDAAEEVQKE